MLEGSTPFAIPSDAPPSVPTGAEVVEGTLSGMPRIRLRNLSKSFLRNDGEKVLAVDDITLDINAGEFLVLLGPSGCGKTTLLRCIAGLERPNSGEVRLDDTVLFSSGNDVNLPPERRRMSMLFQSYALWPHMTVFDNVAYPLRTAKFAKTVVTERVNAVLKRVECANLANQHPGEIGGGQQQRVALARALIANNNVVLFDEPLSNVDAKVREALRLELLDLQRRIGFSAVYVTHDQSEALALADRIAVLDSGHIAQCGSPREIYQFPNSRYIARFVGTLNELPGTWGNPDEGAAGGVVDTLLGAVFAGRSALLDDKGVRVVAVFRPESCQMTTAEPAGPNKWRGTVRAALFLGSYVEYLIDLAGTTVRVWQYDEDIAASVGSEVWVSVSPQRTTALPDDRAWHDSTESVTSEAS